MTLARGQGRTEAERAVSGERAGGSRARLPADRAARVPAAEVRTYYDLPVIKEPAWTKEVPWYLFAGGLAGASSMLAAGATVTGQHRLARVALRTAAVGATASPALLISDLGRPERFLQMLRVFKPTSPLNLGSWLLSAYAPAAIGAAALEAAGRLPRLQRLATWSAAGAGPLMTTYTAVLLADTAVPAWHEARHSLPFVFASSAAAAAGASGVVFAGGPGGCAGPARRLALGGAVAELAATKVMERQLGPLASAYDDGRAGAWSKAAKALTAAGAALVGVGGRRWPALTRSGAVMIGTGSLCQRFAAFHAGFGSARDPEATIRPQRERLEGRGGR